MRPSRIGITLATLIFHGCFSDTTGRELEIAVSAKTVEVGAAIDVALRGIGSDVALDITPSEGVELIERTATVARYVVLAPAQFVVAIPDLRLSTDFDGVCPTVADAMITHDDDTIIADTVWSSSQGRHHIRGTLTIEGATLRVLGCTDIAMSADAVIQVRNGGLELNGSARAPIELSTDGSGAWQGIEFENAAPSRLTFATLRDVVGRETVPGHRAAVIVRGDPATPRLRPGVTLSNVTIADCSDVGVFIENERASSSSPSHDNTITGCGSAPVSVDAASLGAVPRGNFLGNGHDAIIVRGGATSLPSQTWPTQTVPYDVEQSIRILPYASSPLKLTESLMGSWVHIEPGVTMRFARGTGIYVGEVLDGSVTVPEDVAHVALAAHGSPGRPVVFTSMSPAPAAGDWVGIIFGRDARVLLPPLGAGGVVSRYVFSTLGSALVEYAGADSGAVNSRGEPLAASVIALQRVSPTSRLGRLFMEGTLVRHSRGAGAVVGLDSDVERVGQSTDLTAAPNCFCDNDRADLYAFDTTSVCTSGQCSRSCTACASWKATWLPNVSTD